MPQIVRVKSEKPEIMDRVAINRMYVDLAISADDSGSCVSMTNRFTIRKATCSPERSHSGHCPAGEDVSLFSVDHESGGMMMSGSCCVEPIKLTIRNRHHSLGQVLSTAFSILVRPVCIFIIQVTPIFRAFHTLFFLVSRRLIADVGRSG